MAFSQTENPAPLSRQYVVPLLGGFGNTPMIARLVFLNRGFARCPLCPDGDQILQRSEMSPSARLRHSRLGHSRLGHSHVFRLIAGIRQPDIAGDSMIWKVSPPAETGV
jgi:hypothetical protein